jgi:hypothetical protein
VKGFLRAQVMLRLRRCTFPARPSPGPIPVLSDQGAARVTATMRSLSAASGLTVEGQ